MRSQNHQLDGRKRPLIIRRTPLIFAFIFMTLLFTVGSASSSTVLVPTTTVVSVVTDDTVNISGVNFPANQTFTVRMGKMGTVGMGGTEVGSINMDGKTSFSSSFNIPDGLKGQYQISIRLDSTQGYYSYNWFYNNTSSTTSSPTIEYTGIPTITVKEVVEDKTVTIQTHNFPPNQEFAVTMGHMFTSGIGGEKAATFNSGDGGSFTEILDIPDGLKGQYRISIRTQTAHANPYYSYNWFYNNDTAVTSSSNSSDNSSQTSDGVTGGQPTAVYTDIPTFKVCTVDHNSSISITTSNFPPNQKFTITMGAMYTAGIGGTVVGTVDSGDGGSFTSTLDIPDGLADTYRISVRLQTAQAYPYSAYNWFYNNTASICP